MLVNNTEEKVRLLEILIPGASGGEWGSVFLPPESFTTRNIALSNLEPFAHFEQGRNALGNLT